jgi:hypothetical protein
MSGTCVFYSELHSNGCAILNQKCNKASASVSGCKFRKTEEEFFETRNHAVEINRRKGNCTNCKYRTKIKCKVAEKGELDDEC